MRNSEFFARELEWIEDASLKRFAVKYCDLFPPYFEVKPASSSGKYHSQWANSVGGLRKHTKAVMYMTYTLADAYGLTPQERDAAVVAALGHDAAKYSLNGGNHTTSSHAAEGAIFFKRTVKLLNSQNMPMVDQIYLAISNHMGCFCSDHRKFPEDFPKLSQLVHLADMCASRREINFTFIDEENRSFFA